MGTDLVCRWPSGLLGLDNGMARPWGSVRGSPASCVGPRQREWGDPQCSLPSLRSQLAVVPKQWLLGATGPI